MASASMSSRSVSLMAAINTCSASSITQRAVMASSDWSVTQQTKPLSHYIRAFSGGTRGCFGGKFSVS